VVAKEGAAGSAPLLRRFRGGEHAQGVRTGPFCTRGTERLSCTAP